MVETMKSQAVSAAMLKGFEQDGRIRYMNDGSVEVTMKVPLDGIGGIGEMVMGNSISEKPAIKKFEGEKAKKRLCLQVLS
jgi:hypothetical protein